MTDPLSEYQDVLTRTDGLIDRMMNGPDFDSRHLAAVEARAWMDETNRFQGVQERLLAAGHYAEARSVSDNTNPESPSRRLLDGMGRSVQTDPHEDLNLLADGIPAEPDGMPGGGPLGRPRTSLKSKVHEDGEKKKCVGCEDAEKKKKKEEEEKKKAEEAAKAKAEAAKGGIPRDSVIGSEPVPEGINRESPVYRGMVPDDEIGPGGKFLGSQSDNSRYAVWDQEPMDGLTTTMMYGRPYESTVGQLLDQGAKFEPRGGEFLVVHYPPGGFTPGTWKPMW